MNDGVSHVIRVFAVWREVYTDPARYFPLFFAPPRREPSRIPAGVEWAFQPQGEILL
jgi:hypothetical protein